MNEEEEFEFRLRLEQEKSMQAMMEPPPQTALQQASSAASAAGKAAFASSPANLTKEFFETDPGTMQRVGGPVLPIVGGLAAGPAGAAGGEFLRQLTGTALAPDTVPETPLGRAASVVSAGVMQEPKILQAIPGVKQAGEFVSKTGSKMVGGLAKLGEALTGAKAKDLTQAARQGVSTYSAPSMEEASNIFGKAMESAGISGKPPLRQVIDPQLSTARKIALQVGEKLEKGVDIGAGEALQARQAIDRIYNATPMIDRATRGHLADLRTSFDDVISGKSGALKEASTLYRKAIVKSNLLNPFRITKQGQMSAVAPMVATLAASMGAGSGHKTESGLGAMGYLAASSPLIAGLGATAGGSAVRGLMKLGENPATRQVLLGVLQKLMQKKKEQN